MPKTISRDELKQKVDRKDDFLLIETLAVATYHHAHLPAAINLPPDQVTQLSPARLPDKAADIVVYCADGKVSLASRLFTGGNLSVPMVASRAWVGMAT